MIRFRLVFNVKTTVILEFQDSSILIIKFVTLIRQLRPVSLDFVILKSQLQD